MPETKDIHESEQRRKFFEQEKEREAQVDYTKLNEIETKIHLLHKEAVEMGHFTYDDPENGERISTRLRHFLKGACCGKACRHCIYDHVKVPEFKKKGSRFNSSFWVYDDVGEADNEQEIQRKIYGLKEE